MLLNSLSRSGGYRKKKLRIWREFCFLVYCLYHYQNWPFIWRHIHKVFIHYFQAISVCDRKGPLHKPDERIHTGLIWLSDRMSVSLWLQEVLFNPIKGCGTSNELSDQTLDVTKPNPKGFSFLSKKTTKEKEKTNQRKGGT